MTPESFYHHVKQTSFLLLSDHTKSSFFPSSTKHLNNNLTTEDEEGVKGVW